MRRHILQMIACACGIAIATAAAPLTIAADSGDISGSDYGLIQATSSPAKRTFQGDGINDMLIESFDYWVIKTGRPVKIPAGFVTDYASVPALARSLIDERGKHSVPSVLHDFLYWDQSCSREEADLLFYEAMGEYKVSGWARWIVYYAVRAGGGSSWSQNAADRGKGLPRIVPEKNRNFPPNIEWPAYRQSLLDAGVRAAPFPNPPPPKPKYCSLDK